MPRGAGITGARLKLWCDGFASGSSFPLQVSALGQPWDEHALTESQFSAMVKTPILNQTLTVVGWNDVPFPVR